MATPVGLSRTDRAIIVGAASEASPCKAARLKHAHNPGLADAFAAAPAMLLDVSLATTGSDFDPLADEGVKVHKIR